MKTLLILCLFIFSFTGTKLDAQPWYGMQTYPADSCILTSAKVTTNSVGYVMAAYRPIRNLSGSPDFIINKVDGNGQYSTSNDFYGKYQLQDCGGNFIENCFGVNVIETAPTGFNQFYAVVATSTFGIHFMTIDQAGTVVQNLSFDFPGLPYIQKRPAIRESATPGHYYVCASYRADSAVVGLIDATTLFPTFTWANFYNANWIEPTDLIESPYNANELIVVGRCDIPTFAPNADGFFMSLNTINGAPNSFITYTKYIVDHCDEWFSSIEIANSTAGGSNGYALGGRSNYGTVYTPSCNCYTLANYSYTQWMCKLDPTGGLVWSSLIEPKDASSYSGSILPGAEISRVYERYNSNTGKYEYYGVADQLLYPFNTGPILDTNLVVYKLDDGGSNSLSPNEFHYTPGFNQSIVYGNSQITGIETSGGTDDGIQMYYNADPKRLVFTKAYFNGVAGCNDLQVNLDAIHAGPDSVTNVNVNFSGYIPICGGITTGGTSSILGGTVCAASSLASGSNSRSASPLGINTNKNNNTSVNVYPNPSQGEVIVNFEQLNSKDDIKIKIYDNLGLIRAELSEMPKNFIKLNLRNLGLIDGIYYLDITSGQNTTHIKIIFEQ